MRILIIGNGGREHAIAWKVAQSKLVEKVWVAPGNAGTNKENKVTNIAIAVDDIPKLCHFAKINAVDLTIVGPEIPLALGIVDQFNALGLRCYGPSQKAAQLETSKIYCKEFLTANQIPTATFASFKDEKLALDYLANQTFPIVIKADGLASGKGVFIAENRLEAEQAIRQLLIHKPAQTENKIVIEEYLAGEELSYIVMVDGKNILPFASSQDHKRRDDGDKGPNTGGMGAYSPAPCLSDELNKCILNKIIEPTVAAMNQQGTPYQGFLYAGLMISDNQPKVLEFNCRLGDPEAQVILMRLKSDLVEMCLLAIEGKLNQAVAEWDDRPALTVVLAAGGYPGQYKKGDTIFGIDSICDSTSKIFHAGTKQSAEKIVTDGGRVLGVTSLGKNIQAAHDKAYQIAAKIQWQDCFYRHDIGYRALGEKSLTQ